jgi:TolB protein
MKMSLRSLIAALFALMLPFSAQAQTAAPPPIPEADEPELVEFDTSKTRSIAVPALVAPAPADTPAGNSTALGRQIAEVISADLRASGVFETQGPNGLRAITLPEVTAPQFAYWKARPVEQLVQGFVRVGGDGNLTVGCYLYDVGFGNETTRLGFNVPPREWRRAGINVPMRFIPNSLASCPFSTAVSLISPKQAQRVSASSA